MECREDPANLVSEDAIQRGRCRVDQHDVSAHLPRGRRDLGSDPAGAHYGNP
jgi:hypothetical protein